jgi:SnoaL-like protein
MDATALTRATVRAYHQAWTSRRFDQAVALLADELRVEVPINAYPTKASFAAALTAFGGMATRVTVLADFAEDGEAMLLYDMDVEGLGALRVAEHFTIVGGAIVRIRQIHDTAPLRAAGFARSA